jgi:hypothetical protein
VFTKLPANVSVDDGSIQSERPFRGKSKGWLRVLEWGARLGVVEIMLMGMGSPYCFAAPASSGPPPRRRTRPPQST